ncbi:MAG: hypothetical protein KF830_17060 [Planctomycetes bacterium]|nr:hypothetical protein [Planctomycetota bacterium]
MFEQHHDFTFNPDGSGRVRVRWLGPAGADAPPAEDLVRSELEQAEGVDAWADVRCEVEGDRLSFEAVAWFRDPARLRFHGQGCRIPLLDFVAEPLADGGLRLATREQPPAGDEPPPVPADAAAPAALLAAERARLGMARAALDAVFGGLRCSAVVRAPGPLVGPVVGERVDERTVRMAIDGRQLVAALDRLQADDDLLLRLVERGGLTPQSALALFGVQGPVECRIAPGAEPQFDYEREVAAARAALPPWLAALHAAPPAAVPTRPAANVRVVASRIVWEADPERDLCPQGHAQPGLELTLAFDVDGRVVALDDAGFDQLRARDGTDLLPPDEWDRRCHFPKATRDGRTVCLDFRLPVPAGDAFAVLAGQVTATVSDGTAAVDLGLPELAAGAEGQAFGARVLRVEPDDDGSVVLEVQLDVARERVLAAAIHGAEGERPLEPIGHSSWNDRCELTWRVPGPLPADGRLVLTCPANLQRVPIGFVLCDFDLLGRPLPPA